MRVLHGTCYSYAPSGDDQSPNVAYEGAYEGDQTTTVCIGITNFIAPSYKWYTSPPSTCLIIIYTTSIQGIWKASPNFHYKMVLWKESQTKITITKWTLSKHYFHNLLWSQFYDRFWGRLGQKVVLYLFLFSGYIGRDAFLKLIPGK